VAAAVAVDNHHAARYYIRINDRWRVCFRWTEGGAEGVEIVDYH